MVERSTGSEGRNLQTKILLTNMLGYAINEPQIAPSHNIIYITGMGWRSYLK